MPRVPYEPRLGAPGPVQIRPQATPYDNTASGAARIADDVGRGAQALGGAVANALAQERDKADAVAITAAQQELEAYRNDRGYNPEKGFFNQKGENAISGSTAFYDDVGQKRADIAKRLNDRQRPAFERFAGELELDTKRTGEQHVSRQVDEVARQTFLAKQATSMKTLENAYADPVSRAKAMRDAVVATQLEARRQGLPADASKALVHKTIGDAHDVVLRQYLAAAERYDVRALDEARKYLAEPGVEASLGARADVVKKQIEQLGLSRNVEAMAATILKEARPEGSKWLDPEWALGRVDELAGDNPDLAAKLRQRVEHEVTKDGQLRNAEASDKLNEGYGIFAQSKNPNDPRLAKLAVWFLDPANGHGREWASFLDYMDRHGREKSADARSAAAARREQALIDAKALSDYRAMRAENPGEAADYNLKAYTGVSEIAFNELRRMQADTKKGVAGGGQVAVPEAVRMAQEEATGLITDKAELRQFNAYIGQKAEDFIAENKGQKPTRADVRGWIGEGLTRGDRFGGGIGSALSGNRRRFQVKPGQPFVPFAEDEQDSDLAKASTTRPLSQKEVYAQVRAEHPDWTPAEIAAEARKRFRK